MDEDVFKVLCVIAETPGHSALCYHQCFKRNHPMKRCMKVPAVLILSGVVTHSALCEGLRAVELDMPIPFPSPVAPYAATMTSSVTFTGAGMPSS
jgi:hypothetical protein